MKKLFAFILPLIFLSAGCSLFGQTGSAGLAKTVNGGVDWVLANKLSEGTGNLANANISTLAVSPNNHETVYAGSYNGGLFISADSGGSWKNILSKISVYDFAVNPADPNTIYAAGDYGGLGKVLKTTDGGKSWLQKYNEAAAATPVRSLALNPQNLNQIVIGTESGNVIISDDGGDSWRLVKNFGSRISRVYWTNAGVYVLVRSGGLYKGSGAADDFAAVSKPLKDQSLLNQFANPGAVKVFNQAYIDPFSPNLLYITTDRGLYKSTDGGNTYAAVKLPVKQEDINPRPVVVSRQSSNIVLTASGGTVYKSTDGGNSFQTQSVPFVNGFVNYILVDPILPQIMYAGGYIITQ